MTASWNRRHWLEAELAGVVCMLHIHAKLYICHTANSTHCLYNTPFAVQFIAVFSMHTCGESV